MPVKITWEMLRNLLIDLFKKNFKLNIRYFFQQLDVLKMVSILTSYPVLLYCLQEEELMNELIDISFLFLLKIHSIFNSYIDELPVMQRVCRKKLNCLI